MMKSKSRELQKTTMTTEPTLIAPTAGTCATCFYGQKQTSDIGRLCRVAHPARMSDASQRGAWPVVADDDWCGEGIDNTNFGSFRPGATQAPAAAVPVYMAPNPNPGGTQTHLTGTAAAQSLLIRSGAGWITGITVNSVATGSATLTCYDGLDATGSVIAVIDISKSNPSPQTAAPWGFSTGFFVVISNGSAGADITIVSHSV